MIRRIILLNILCLTIVSCNLQAMDKSAAADQAMQQNEAIKETAPESFLRMLTTANVNAVKACILIETAGNGISIQKRNYTAQDVEIALFLISRQLKAIDNSSSSTSSQANAERNWYNRAQEAITTLQKSIQSAISEFMFAAQKGDAQLVMRLIEGGVNVDTITPHRETALMFASKNGHTAIVGILISKGANVNASTNYLATSLMLAAQNGHRTIVEKLITAGANVDATTSGGKTALMFAVQNGHIAIVQILIEARANIYVKDNNRDDALMLASLNGHKDIVELLLNHGAFNKPNETVFDKIADILSGVNPNQTLGINHNTAKNTLTKDCAKTTGHQVLAEMQQKTTSAPASSSTASKAPSTAAQGPSCSQPQPLSASTITLPTMNPSASASSSSVTTDRHPASQSNNAYDMASELMVAAQSGSTETARNLIAAGAAVNSITSDRKTPLMFAAQNGHTAIVEILIAAGANINATNNFGDTALIYAALNGHKDIVELLLKHGADTRTLNAQNKTAYDIVTCVLNKLNVQPSPENQALRTKFNAVKGILIIYHADITGKKILAERQQQANLERILNPTPIEERTSTITARAATISVASSSSSCSNQSTSSSVSAAMSLSTQESTSYATTQPPISEEAWGRFVETVITDIGICTLSSYNKIANDQVRNTLKNQLLDLYPAPGQFDSLKAFIDAIMNILMNNLLPYIPPYRDDDFRTDTEKALRTLLESNDVISMIRPLLLGFKLKAAAEVVRLHNHHDDDNNSGAPGAMGLYERKQWQKVVKIKPDSLTSFHIARFGLTALMSFGTQALHKHVVPGQKVSANILAAASAA